MSSFRLVIAIVLVGRASAECFHAHVGDGDCIAESVDISALLQHRLNDKSDIANTHEADTEREIQEEGQEEDKYDQETEEELYDMMQDKSEFENNPDNEEAFTGDDGSEDEGKEVDPPEIIDPSNNDTFESARPGPCCMSEPSVRMTWSKFASTSESMANQSSGKPIVVACDTEVTVDHTITETLPGLQVMGSLKFQDGVDIQLKTKWVFVCGNFSVGSPAQAHKSKVEIILEGTDSVISPTTSTMSMGGHFGKTGFITFGGYTYLHGTACGTTIWTRLKASVQPGATEIEIQGTGALTWEPGDKLLIATSTYTNLQEQITGSGETEEVEITKVNGRKITLTGELKYSHDGCDPETHPGLGCVYAAEVALLSRNIAIKGEPGCAPMCGHFMVAHTNTGHFCGAEFTNLGQTGVEGRYPFHIHLPGNSPDMVIKENSVHHNQQRGIVLHGIHNVTVENNVVYMTKGHLIMLEDGVEMDNRLINNLALHSQRLDFGCRASHDKTFKCPDRSDKNPNAIWISNPQNIFEGNVGVGVRGAFFFETRFVTGRTRQMYPVEAKKAGVNGKIKGRVPIKHFRNNMAHSCGLGVGNYPKMSFKNSETSAGYENFTSWRNQLGISVHNSKKGWPVVGARLLQNAVGLRVGRGEARVIVRKSIIVAGRKALDGTGRKVSVPMIINKMGRTEEGKVALTYADTDKYTSSWTRCYGSYEDVSQPRFHSFIWNVSWAEPCDSFEAPPSSLKYAPPKSGAQAIEGYLFKLGWIGGYAKGHKSKYSLEEAIKKCNDMGDSCGGVTCATVKLEVCTVRAQRYVRKGKKDVTASYLKDPNSVFTTTQARGQDQSSLWTGKTPEKYCKFYRWQKVETQSQCQDACKDFALCIGIVYSDGQGFSSDCFMCRDKNLLPHGKSFSFYPRPGGSTVKTIPGYTFKEGWLGGFAKGDQSFFSLSDAIKKCEFYKSRCGGVTCTPDLHRCTVRGQSWIRGGKDTLSYVKDTQ